MSNSLRARNAMKDERRVVVTGVGVLAANGIGKDAFWRSLVAGESGIRRVTLCDVTGLDSQIAGEVKGFDPETFLAPRFKSRHVSRTAQLALGNDVHAGAKPRHSGEDRLVGVGLDRIADQRVLT